MDYSEKPQYRQNSPSPSSEGRHHYESKDEKHAHEAPPVISGVQQDPDLVATQEEEDAVFRKLDWRLLPFVFVLYSLSVLDRSNLGNARLAGLEDAINLTGWRYNWLGTIFYISCTLIPLPCPATS